MSFQKYPLLLLNLCCSVALAGEVLGLDEGDIKNLGIGFAPVAAAGVGAGAQVPGEVVNSPESRSVLIAPYNGVIEQWHVAPGATVAAGDVLAEVASQEIVELQELWIAASNRLDEASVNLERDQQLFSDGIIAEKRLSQSRRDQVGASFALKAAQEKLNRAGFDRDRRAQLAAGTLQPGRYFITAPVAGELAERNLDVGDSVQAQGRVGLVLQAGTPWLRAQVPAAIAPNLKVGQLLSIADSADLLVLRQKDMNIDPASQTVEILAEFNGTTAHPRGKILSLVLPDADGGLLIPAEAVVHTGNRTTLYVRRAEGVEALDLELKPAGRDYVAVEGLALGDEIIVKGAAVLKGMELGLGGDE